MSNTTIAIKKSATPSAEPTNLANGELALNFADGKLFYKNVTGQIVSFTSGSNSFGTVNANNTLIVADTVGDVLTVSAGNNITITADAINDKITISGDSTISVAAFNKANTIISVKDFGAVGDGSADDTAAVQNAINNAVATQSSLYIPEGRYLITRDLTTPTSLNGQYGFEIRGDGKDWQTTLMFSGANVKEGLVIYDPVRTSSAYVWWGKFKDFGMYFSSGANGGFQIRYASHPTIENIRLHNATKGLIVDNCNKPLVTDSMIIGSGNTTFPQVTINKCTALGFHSNYLAGSQNATGIVARAGLEIDRSSTATIMNNAIETCGPLIRIACNSPDDAYGCDEITLIGNNLENATNQYVEVGTGWTTGFSVRNLTSIGNHGSISGSTTVKNGFKINRIAGFYSKGDSLAINTGLTNAASFFFETEAASIGTVIEQARTEYGNPVPWVSYGGVTANSATPFARYSDLENSNLRTNKTVFANNTTDSGIIDNSLFMPQGGLIRTMFVSANTPAEGVIKALKYTPLNGDLFTILATGSNVSIDHAASETPAGSARFYTQDEKRLNLAPSQSITFIYNASNGLLVQLTSALTRSPQIVANTITANTLSMTNMTVSNTVTSTRFQAGSTAGVSNASVTAILSSGNLGNCYEWGHSNPSGYRSTLGAFASAGPPFIGFQCEAGTTINTFRTRGLPGFVINSDTTGRLNFQTVPTASADNQTPTHVAVIDQNGNVAIGATTSAYKLRVVGAVNNTSLEGNTIIAHVSSASTLGVGTNSPNTLSKIHIVGTSLAEGNFHLGDSQRGFFIDPINVFTYGMAKSAAGSSASLFLYSNGVKATIQATGNVGIGTTTPTSNLHVIGTANITSNLVVQGEDVLSKITTVGTGANAFTSATISGANTAVGTGANAFTSATISGANTAVGAGANAYAASIANTIAIAAFDKANTGGSGSLTTYSANVGNGAANTYNVSHNLNSYSLLMTMREISTGYIVYPDLQQTTANNLVITFVDNPTANQYALLVAKVA